MKFFFRMRLSQFYVFFKTYPEASADNHIKKYFMLILNIPFDLFNNKIYASIILSMIELKCFVKLNIMLISSNQRWKQEKSLRQFHKRKRYLSSVFSLQFSVRERCWHACHKMPMPIFDVLQIFFSLQLQKYHRRHHPWKIVYSTYWTSHIINDKAFLFRWQTTIYNDKNIYVFLFDVNKHRHYRQQEKKKKKLWW